MWNCHPQWPLLLTWINFNPSMDHHYSDTTWHSVSNRCRSEGLCYLGRFSNRNHQQWSQSLVVKLGIIDKARDQFRTIEIKENHNIKNILSHKQYDENIWHVNITNICHMNITKQSHFSSSYTSLVVAIFTSPLILNLNLETNSVIPGLTTRDSEHYLWSLFGKLSHAMISMMTSSNGNIFRVIGHLCGEFTGPGEFPAQSPVTQSFDVFFDLRLNKRLSK